MSDTKHLLHIERDRKLALEEFTTILQHVGIQIFPISVENFSVSALGLHLEPVETLESLLNAMPTSFVLVERTQFSQITLRLRGQNGAFAFIIRDHRNLFVGILVTDLFFTNHRWIFDTIYRSSGASKNIKALLTPLMEPYVKELGALKEFYDDVNTPA